MRRTWSSLLTCCWCAQVSPVLKDFLGCMLTHDTKQRSSAANLLEHPFLLQADSPRCLIPLVERHCKRMSLCWTPDSHLWNTWENFIRRIQLMFLIICWESCSQSCASQSSSGDWTTATEQRGGANATMWTLTCRTVCLLWSSWCRQEPSSRVYDQKWQFHTTWILFWKVCKAFPEQRPKE